MRSPMQSNIQRPWLRHTSRTDARLSKLVENALHHRFAINHLSETELIGLYHADHVVPFTREDGIRVTPGRQAKQVALLESVTVN